MGRSVAVRVPASSANLGPGFDVLAAALGVHMQLLVEEADAFAVHTDLAIARDHRNLVVRAFSELLDPDAFAFTITSEIPLSGGLGTSAAAYVGGLLAARALGGDEDADLLALATKLEGHPDNVAASLLGGVVVCAAGTAERIEPPADLEAVLVVPDTPVRTREARAVLPKAVPMAETVYTAGQAALLTLGLERGDHALIARGLNDVLHQPRRAELYPRSMELIAAARHLGAIGATISGAGPTVLMWCTTDSAASVAAACEERGAGWAQVLRAGFEPAGGNVVYKPAEE